MTKSIIKENAKWLKERWTCDGIECAILAHPTMGHMNGYVQVPDPSRLPEGEYGEIDLEVHFGITYGPDEDGWIGFDTAHAGDVWPDRPDPFNLMSTLGILGNVRHWDTEKLRTEVESLAHQVASCS